ncbi:hypothetical protein BV25DRAFT_1825276 [Artomyces pyxidatus]|uniref:Uncharacterized protein n=1 Tax=Artomyces pyxidatus TaxID=48021 RepID=A0ACB8T2Y6_9AGAM|nr:hypothetical protein BV25DRAFT_1825276 [Artomyces pyxidatus]
MTTGSAMTPGPNPASVQFSHADQPYEEERSLHPRQGGEGRVGEGPRGELEEPRRDAQGGEVQNASTATERTQRKVIRPESADPKTQDKKDESVNPLETMWPMYLEESKKEDNNLVDNITIYTNGVLVFTGLFGAIVTAFIIESYKQLQPPDSGTTAALALFAQLSLQIIASSNGTHLPVPGVSNTLDSSSFRPSSSALRVNIFWFLSLSLSLSCALGAALMQQWARRYISNTEDAQRAGTLDTHGRIHAYLFLGLQTFRFKAAVEALPALLHASVILFFVGLIDFLFPINKTVAYVLLSFVSLGTLLYFALTILPSLWPNSPYATPLSAIMAYAVSFVGLILYAIILVLKGAINLITYPHRRFLFRLRLQTWRSHPMLFITSIFTTILHAATLVPGAIIRLVTSNLGAIARVSGRFMKSNFLPYFSADNLESTALKLQSRSWDLIDYCRVLVFASTRKKLRDVARSHDEVELNALMWTLATVMDDAVKLGKCFQCIHLFLQLKEHERAETASKLQETASPHLELHLTSVLQLKEREVAEIRSRLRDADDLGDPLSSVLHNIAVSLKSADEMQAEALRERAKSCVDLMRMLQNDGMNLYRAIGMGKALSELRQDTDTDLAVSATCTSAFLHFHYQFRKFLAGPADDVPPDEADLKDAKTIWATNVSDFWDVDGAIAFVSFTQSVLPRLKYASCATVELVWKTFGYSIDTGPSATNTRSLSWDTIGHFPVGGDLDIKWRKQEFPRSPDSPERFEPGIESVAKLVPALRRLRTTILDTGAPDPLDADPSFDALPEPREMYKNLYINLRQLYRFLTEYEALLRAAADSAPTASIAGPSTSPTEFPVHLAERNPVDDPQVSDPQLWSTDDVP